MKKLLSIITLALLALGVSACSATTEKTVLTSEQSLVSMAYLSSNFLSFNQETTSQGLAFNLADDDFEIDNELESVSEYVQLLKSFMENGASGFANISEELSDREEYENKITVVVAEEVYLLYYNVNSETKEISGIFVINEEEYTITAYSYLDDNDDFYEDEDDDDDDDFYEEDDDDDEDDADDMAFTNLSEVTTTEETTTEETTTVVTNEEYEKKMVLIARNGDNYIEIKYEVEVEDDETETKFELETYINGIEKEITIEIKIEKDEYKIEIEDGDNSYEFKREVEDGGIKYELEYEVNGVEGEIEIFETTNELGETVYIYKIEEEGRTKEVEIDDDDDDDDEDDDDDDEDDDLIETGFII